MLSVQSLIGDDLYSMEWYHFTCGRPTICSVIRPDFTRLSTLFWIYINCHKFTCIQLTHWVHQAAFNVVNWLHEWKCVGRCHRPSGSTLCGDADLLTLDWHLIRRWNENTCDVDSMDEYTSYEQALPGPLNVADYLFDVVRDIQFTARIKLHQWLLDWLIDNGMASTQEHPAAPPLL